MTQTEDKKLIKVLSNHLEKFRIPGREPVPSGGWIKNIRTILNIPNSYLAKKIGKSNQAIREYEKSEFKETITIESLRKIADAMDMDLVYGFVPRRISLYAKISSAIESSVIKSVKDVPQESQKNILARYNRAMLIQQMMENLPKSFWDKKTDVI